MLVFFDLETMGLTENFCSILEIAAICCEDDGRIIDTFHEYINPNRPIPDNIVALTRITDEKVRNCRRERDVLETFVAWMRGMGVDTLVAHNGSFDMRFLRGRSLVCYLDTAYIDTLKLVDTMSIARKLIKAGKFTTEKTPSGRISVKQESIAKALGVEYGDGGAHSAIEDVMVLKQIYYLMEAM